MSKNLPISSSSRKSRKYRGAECLNCGQPLDLSDKFCPYCSQLNSTKQLTFTDFFAEFINSIVSYDSRMRYTIRDLLLKPGVATRNYIKGQRLKYANPFRFYLSVSIIYFLLQGFIAFFSPSDETFFKMNKEDTTEVNEAVDEGVYALSKNGKPHSKEPILKDTVAQTEVKDSTSTQLTDGEIAYISEKDLDTLSWAKRTISRFELYRDFYKKNDIKSASIALDSLNHNNSVYNRWLYNKNNALERVIDNPKAFADYLMKKIPFFIFFFTPFYALFFWLIYSKKKFNYLSHIIFIFHVFSFLFLASIICLLPDAFFKNDFFQGILLFLIGPFYFYKALRNFYKQSRFITLIKFVLLNIVFWIGATITATLFFFITAAVY